MQSYQELASHHNVDSGLPLSARYFKVQNYLFEFCLPNVLIINSRNYWLMWEKICSLLYWMMIISFKLFIYESTSIKKRKAKGRSWSGKTPANATWEMIFFWLSTQSCWELRARGKERWRTTSDLQWIYRANFILRIESSARVVHRCILNWINGLSSVFLYHILSCFHEKTSRFLSLINVIFFI